VFTFALFVHEGLSLSRSINLRRLLRKWNTFRVVSFTSFALAFNYPPNVNVPFTLGLYYYFLRRTQL
ncbi:MAG: hypothetical protein ACTS41_01020, partial [Candidatus Hodgkinia cicadicola]